MFRDYQKKIASVLLFKCVTLIFCGAIGAAFAAKNELFHLNARCSVTIPYTVTLCLNAKGPLSCQDYIVDGTALDIKTTIPNHLYPLAGIKVHSPIYTPTHCVALENGYCMFPANDVSIQTIEMISMPGFMPSFVC